jgi:dephospho-CoA kinase
MQPNWLLCGGIGSGKSAVRLLLEAHGVNTIDADAVGHEVLAVGGDAFSEVAAEWPSVLVGGTIDRAALGRIVFSDPEELRKLEALTHPHIFSLIEGRVRSLQPPVVVEVPLLAQPFESPWARMVVDAPEELRVERAVERGIDRQDVLRRIVQQPTRAQWLAAADLVIPNHRDLTDLDDTVASIMPLFSDALRRGSSDDDRR